MILASGGPEVIITADMLPQDVGSMVPAMPTSNNGEHIMGLPLREAREVFERDYLIAQISRFSGNISRTAEFVSMERSALHCTLKSPASGSPRRSHALTSENFRLSSPVRPIATTMTPIA